MCTIGLNHKLKIVFKNRDKNIPTQEEIVEAGDYIAVRTKGADYYSLGFNKFGCGFVSAAVNTPRWTRLAEEGKKEGAAALAKEEGKGLISPMILLSEMLPKVRGIEEWANALLEAQGKFRGYNIILADLHSAEKVEVFRKKIKSTSGHDSFFVSTNHFQRIVFGPKTYSDYPNSFERYKYAEERLGRVRTLKDVFAMLKPKDVKRQELIWRKGNFSTVSTSVIDLSGKCLYYSEALNKEYRKICL